jgi:hypothetical protein
MSAVYRSGRINRLCPMTERTSWTQIATLSVKGGSPSSPQETEIPWGPGHPRTRIRHSHGPDVYWRSGGKRGMTERHDTLELTDATIFRVEPGSGQATLIVETATN